MRAIIAALLLVFSISFAEAQMNRPCVGIPGGQTGNCVPVDSTNPLPVYQGGSSFANITTNADTNVKAAPGTFVGIVVNTAGTTSTAKIYNDADGTCSSGLIATINTTALITLMYGISNTVGICVTTAGAAAADITILYR